MEAARLNKLKNDHEAAVLATSTGIEFLKAGDLERAIERFGAVVKLDPSYPEARRQLSVALGKKGRVK